MKMNYRTFDLNISAYLVAKGYTLLAVEELPGSHRGLFVFPPEALETANEYFKGGQVTAQRFASALRELKAQIKHTMR